MTHKKVVDGKSTNPATVGLKLSIRNPAVADILDEHAYYTKDIQHKALYADNSIIECGLIDSVKIQISYLQGMLSIKTASEVDVYLQGDIPATAVIVETKGLCTFSDGVFINQEIGLYISAPQIIIDMPIVNARYACLLAGVGDNASNIIHINQHMSARYLLFRANSTALSGTLQADKVSGSSKYFEVAKTGKLLIKYGIGFDLEAKSKEEVSKKNVTNSRFEQAHYLLLNKVISLKQSTLKINNFIQKGTIELHYVKINSIDTFTFAENSISNFNHMLVAANLLAMPTDAKITGVNVMFSVPDLLRISSTIDIDGIIFNAESIEIERNGAVTSNSHAQLNYKSLLTVLGKVRAMDTTIDGEQSVVAFGGELGGTSSLNMRCGISAVIFGRLYGHMVNHKAGFMVNVCGLTSAYTGSFDSVNGLELGNLHTPYVNTPSNTTEAYTYLEEKASALISSIPKNRTDLRGVAKSVYDNAWPTLSKHFGVIRYVVASASLPVASGVTVAYQTASLMVQLTRIYASIKKTNRNITEISKKELLLAILELKGLTVSGAALYNNAQQAHALCVENSALKAENSKTFQTIATDLGLLFAPSLQNDALLSISAPLLSATITDTRQNLYSFRAGVNVAWNQYEVTVFDQVDYSTRYADTLLLNAGRRFQNGHAHANHLVVQVNELHVAKEGSIWSYKSTQGVVERDLTSDGNVHLAPGTFRVKGAAFWSHTSTTHYDNVHLHYGQDIRNGAQTYNGETTLVTDHAASSIDSSLTATTEESKFHLFADTADLKGAEKHHNVAYKVKGMPIIEMEELFHGTGQHANKEVGKSIFVETEVSVDVTIRQSARGENVHHGLITPGKINVVEDFKGAGLTLQSTKNDINIQKNVSTASDQSYEAAGSILKPKVTTESEAGNVLLRSGADIDNSHGGKISAKQGYVHVESVSTEGHKIDNDSYGLEQRSTIEGADVYINAASGKVANRHGLIRAGRFVQVYAGGDIDNTALEVQRWHGHSNATEYHGGEIIGGTGNEHSNGYGLVIDAGGFVNNYASTIGSAAHTYVHGAKGVVHWTAHSIYKAEDSKQKHGAVNKIYTTADGVLWAPATIFGEYNTICSSEGSMRIHGANILAPGGSKVWSKEEHVTDAAIVKLKTRTEKVRVKTFHSDKDNITESDRAAIFQTECGPIEVISTNNNIHVTGAVFMGSPERQATLLFKAAGDIHVNPTVLNNSMRQREWQFSINVAGQAVYGGYHGTWLQSLASLDQSFSSFNDFTQSRHPLDALINGYSALSGLDNLAGSIAQDGITGTLLKRTGVSFGVTRTDTRYDYQTLGGGCINGFDQVSFDSENGDVDLGVDIDDVRKLYVHANNFRAHGTELNSRMRHFSHAIGGTVGLTGAVDASASAAYAESETKEFTQHKARVSVLEVHAKVAELANSEIISEEAYGEVDTLITRSLIGSTKSKEQSLSASTSGNVSFSTQSSFRQTADGHGALKVTGKDGMEIGKHVEYGRSGLVGANDEDITPSTTIKEHHNVDLKRTRRGLSAGTKLTELGNPEGPHTIQFGVDTQNRVDRITQNGLQNIRDDGHKFNLVHQTKAKPPEIKEINTEETTDRQKTFADANDNASISDITEKQPSIVGAAIAQLDDDGYLSRPYMVNSAAYDDANVSATESNKPPQRRENFIEQRHANWYEPAYVSNSNTKIAVEFTQGVAAGIAVNGAIFRASSIKYVGSFIRGASLLGAGVMVAEAFGMAADFERDNFMYTEEYEHIISNPLISEERKTQLLDESLQRQANARREAEQLKGLADKFVENPMIFGFGVGSFLSIEQLPDSTLAANAFMNLRIRNPLKSVPNERHLEFLNKVVKAPVGIEHIEIATGGKHGFENFANARTMAAIRANLGDNAVPYLSKVGPQAGNVYVGMGTSDSSCLWRLDLNTRVPRGKPPIPHINWQYYDHKSGKRYQGAINIDMTVDEYCQILNKFPRKYQFIAPVPYE